MALPPDLPPDRTAIQRIRRIQYLKRCAQDLGQERRATVTRLRRAAVKAAGHLLVVYGFAYFVIDVAFSLLLGDLALGPSWVFGALLPAVLGVIGSAQCAVHIALDLQRLRRIAIDLRHHKAEILRLGRM